MLETPFDHAIALGLEAPIYMPAMSSAGRGTLRSLKGLGAALGQEGAKPGLKKRKLDEVSRTKERSERQHQDRPFTATPTGRAFFRRYTLLQNLAAHMRGPDGKPPKKLRSKKLRKLIFLVDYETLALVAVAAPLNAIVAAHTEKVVSDRPDESIAMKLALSVGRSLRDEIEMASLRARDKDSYRRVMGAKSRRRAVSPHRELDWSNDVLVHAGTWLLNCAKECDLFEFERRKVGRNKLLLLKIANDRWPDIQEIRDELSLARPYYLPHLKPPPDWTSFRTEYGPDRLPATFVRDEHPDTVAAIKKAFENGKLERHASGVSNVQRVPWRINEFMLPVVEKLAPNVERRFKTAAGDGAECLKTALRDDIELARQLVGQPFWTPYNIDFRGRLNAIPHFNIGREDRVRSLFLFWNGQKVGNSASWIEIAVANAAGQKGTWRERHDWVFENRDLIRDVAVDPFNTFGEWKIFSKPFQFVAACREFVEAQNDPDFVTHLPIFLDGTANGVQHLACLSRDEESGRLVNLMDLDERNDIYDVIAKNVIKRLEDAGDKRAEWWLSGERLTRRMFKDPVMTFSYGVTDHGVWGQIREAYKEKHWNEPEPDFSHVDYLAKLIDKVTREVLERPHKVKEFIRKLAKLRASRNRPLEWETPSGLPVISNRCYEPNVRTVETKLDRTRVEYQVTVGRKDKIIEAKAINQGPANFVHSMDAAHLVLSVNDAAVRDGIVDVAVVHDCYGALAPQVLRFQQIIRVQMVAMYRWFDVLGDLRKSCEPVPDDLTLRETGTLVLEKIQTADYTFT
jgi:DNA-directed RNA polymerase